MCPRPRSAAIRVVISRLMRHVPWALTITSWYRLEYLQIRLGTWAHVLHIRHDCLLLGECTLKLRLALKSTPDLGPGIACQCRLRRVGYPSSAGSWRRKVTRSGRVSAKQRYAVRRPMRWSSCNISGTPFPVCEFGRIRDRSDVVDAPIRPYPERAPTSPRRCRA